jgi:hypothetical protein
LCFAARIKMYRRGRKKKRRQPRITEIFDLNNNYDYLLPQ